MNKDKIQRSRFLIKRITLIDEEGSRTTRHVCIGTNDIERFRKQQKGSRYKDVELIYEQLDGIETKEKQQ